MCPDDDDTSKVMQVLDSSAENGINSSLVSLETAAKRARYYAEASQAENSKKAYEADWANYEAWCDENDLIAHAPNPVTVASYLAAMADGGSAASSVWRAASGIAWYLRAADPVTWPPKSWPLAVKKTLVGIKRKHGRPPHAKQAMTLALVQAALPHLGAGLEGLRNRAIVLTAFWGGRRRSEVVRLNVRDLEFSPAGLVMMIPRAKTDQEGKGFRVAVKHTENDAICAPCNLVRWLKAARIRSGAVFRVVTPEGNVTERRVGMRLINDLVHRGAEAIGLDPRLFGSHSLRAGFVTTAAQKGKSLDAIMRQTGHKSVEQVREYIRHATIFDDNATEDLE